MNLNKLHHTTRDFGALLLCLILRHLPGSVLMKKLVLCCCNHDVQLGETKLVTLARKRDLSILENQLQLDPLLNGCSQQHQTIHTHNPPVGVSATILVSIPGDTAMVCHRGHHHRLLHLHLGPPVHHLRLQMIFIVCH